MKNKNILYLSYDGMTDPLGQSQVLPYIVGLTKEGYQFTLISCEKKERYNLHKDTIKNICTENKIDWQPIFYTKKPPVISTIWDIYQLNKKVKKLHKQKQFQLIHCRSYITALIGLGFKQKHHVKFLFDMRGFWADERVDGNIWDVSKWHYKVIYNYFKKKEKHFLDGADAIVSLTYAAKKIMQENWGIKTPISVIPCATDMDLFKPQAKKSNKNIVLGYLGSIGTWYMLDEMLDFFNVFLLKYPTATFKFITQESPSYILEKAKEKGINSSHFEINTAKREDVPAELSKIDIGIFFIRPTFSKQASSPVKQGELMSMGIPVITNSGVGDTDNIINKYQSGILITKFDTLFYEEAISNITDLLKQPTEKMIEGAKAYFSLKKGINDYLDVYKKMLS